LKFNKFGSFFSHEKSFVYRPNHIFQVKKTLVISGPKLMKTITLKQILFKAKKILNKIQYPKERKKETKTPQTQPKKRASRERES
jgi:hypothetical protein